MFSLKYSSKKKAKKFTDSAQNTSIPHEAQHLKYLELKDERYVLQLKLILHLSRKFVNRPFYLLTIEDSFLHRLQTTNLAKK